MKSNRKEKHAFKCCHQTKWKTIKLEKGQSLYFNYSRDLLTCNARYLQTLSEQKWRSFNNSFRSMLKLRSTEREVAWQFNNFARRSRLLFGQVISAIAPQPWF